MPPKTSAKVATKEPPKTTKGPTKAKAQLTKFIKSASTAYYEGEPIVDDATFDAAVDSLAKIDPENKLLETVGRDSSDSFKKRKHLMAMGSLAKARNVQELEKWIKREIKRDTPDCFIVTHKIDGMSIELQYDNGTFKHAVTRGDGRVSQGDDITANVLKIKGLCKNVKGDFTGSVRGEIIMTKTMHEKRFPNDTFKRNVAIGIAKRPDGVGCKDLIIVVYDVCTGNVDDFPTEREKMTWLAQFPYVAEMKKCSGIEGIVKWYETLSKTRDDLDIAIDGLVIKCNSVDLDDMQRAKPNRQLALKFPPKGDITTLLSVKWNVSGRTYTPVAMLEPIVIDGCDHDKASLHNPGILRALGLRIGSQVSLIKCNDIIPQISSVIEVGDGDDVEFPTVCVNCKALLECTDTKLFCPNKDCVFLLHHQIGKWITVHDIKEFGDKLIDMIYEQELVTELADLYTLTVEDLEGIVSEGKRLGAKNAKKAIDNLHAKKELGLAAFVAGFDILNIGERNVDTIIAAGYDTLAKLRKATVDDLIKIKGIKENKAIALIDGLKHCRKHMDNMLKHVTIVKAVEPQAGGLDASFCFTGALTIKRKDAEEMVKKAGGTIKKSVGAGLTYLVCADPESGSKKNTDAQNKGVTVIGEKEFLRLMG